MVRKAKRENPNTHINKTPPRTLDGGVEGLCDGDHDVGAKDPENVVDKEAPEEDKANLDAANRDEHDARDGKREPKDVVCDPVLPAKEVPRAKDGRERKRNKVHVVKRQLPQRPAVLAAAAAVAVRRARKLGSEWGRSKARRKQREQQRAERAGEGEHADDEKVRAQNEIHVFFPKEAEEEIEAKQGTARIDGEHRRVLRRQDLDVALGRKGRGCSAFG